MSHFAVIVVGTDIEKQMQPYHEFECTGINDEYVVEIDITEKYREDYLKSGSEFTSLKEFCEEWYGTRFLPVGQTPDPDGDHMFGYGLVDENDNVVKVVERTNPNAKWDYWGIGGRWRDTLKLKENETNGIYGEKAWEVEGREDTDRLCDSTFKGLIDIEGMEKPMREQASMQWDEWHAGIKNLPSDDIEKDAWLTRKLGIFVSNDQIDRLNNMAREEYIDCMSTWSPYAIVWEGRWYSEGDMGWFGLSSNKENDWKGQFKELWAQIPDDAQITMVDCHI